MKTRPHFEHIKEQFLGDVKGHEMTVIRDSDVDRYIRFKRQGTNDCYFDVITWPGHLLITGDCGTWVFERAHDMFLFFSQVANRGDLSINPGYWSEKLIANDRNGEAEQFCFEKFKAIMVKAFREYKFDSPDERSECWDQFRDEVLNCDENGVRAYDAVSNFHWDGKAIFDDEIIEFSRFNDYSFHFIWNCIAIVWAIKQYNASKIVPEALPELVA